jgi:hypothetical protein
MVRSTATALLAALLLIFATRAAPAAGCQWAGWSPEDISRHATLIVEADVVDAIEPAGRVLYVRHSYRGSSDGATVQVGTKTVASCFGRLPLEVGDHVVLALADPDSANAGESVAWWVDSDGSTIIGWMGADFEQLATLAEVKALLSGLPETAAEDDPPVTPPSLWPILAALFVLAFAVSWRRFAGQSIR